MSILASELIGRVSIMGARKAIADLESVGAASDSVGLRMAKLGALGLVGVGVAVAAIGVEAVKMAGDFQSGLTTLVTGAGEARSAIDKVGQGILQISVDTATPTDNLIKAMFQIESGGYRASQGLQVLKIAAEGAREGNSDLTKTTDILLTTMHNYHLTAGQATGAMNSLVVTMKNGRMVMNDLNAALIKVLPTASALKIPLEDVQGALDSMSAAGDKGAAAGTHLTMMFKMLTNPMGAAKKEMAAMGINSIELAQTMRTSLPDALQMIQDAVAQHFVPGSVQYNQAIAAILGGSKSGVAGLEILGGGMKLLRDNTNAASDALHKGGKEVQGWADVQKNLNFQLDQAHRAWDALLIRLGTNLLPIVSQDMAGLATNVQRAAGWISDIATKTINTKQWQDLAKSSHELADQMGKAAQNTGDFIDKFSKTGTGKGLFAGIGDAVSQTIDQFNELAAQLNIIHDLISHKTTIDFEEANVMLGKWGQTTLSVADAQDLLGRGIKQVTNAQNGENINLAEYIRSGGRFTNTTLSMTAALKAVGETGKGAFLTSNDAAKLLALGITSVDDNVHHTSVDLRLLADMNIKPKVDASSIVQAGNAAGATLRRLQALNGTSIWTSYTNYINTGGPLVGGHGFASGTDSAPGGMAWVGERGPELMYVPQGAKIYPHQQSVNMAHGSANQPVYLQVDGHTFARFIMPHIVDNIRFATGIRGI